MTDPYFGREQTKAKHFILKSYLQALAFKVLNFSDLTYVDGFSGPWKSQTEDFSDSSFMIAIHVLKDAQSQVLARTGKRRRIRCFFSEKDAKAYSLLESAVVEFHKPEDGFEIKTHEGKFEDAVDIIRSFVGASFPLIFIDPTGWKGYPFDKIRPLFARAKCEVLINFMYDFINRFAYSPDPETIESLAPILGGPDWPNRLDRNIPRGLAVEKLFRDTLQKAGDFEFVVSTKIDKATAERPHFFIAYGTKSAEGLKTFRETEYDALRRHAKDRAHAIEARREERLNVADMFAGHRAEMSEATVEEIVAEQKRLAADRILELLAQQGPLKFSQVVPALLQPFMLRKTNVKDICVDLAKAGRIENVWGNGNRKPREEDVIRLRPQR
ncbi:three-Cys-motif partner protein TcmP [Bradyrhizobium sp. BR13661]|uniref:three-Cys-motif partner protein TcmP n=1 Tax=Bradyrhizobium sp. BR13661 TaxID=2940622 RepID=UPI0024737ABB|nr:three-Cys-motif partner protein TcmP [Bradyrhizobium sp. BR13661]MDH6260709.1 three-Cys-motif partner protein [Bradyrhizobium sp. BR13661]